MQSQWPSAILTDVYLRVGCGYGLREDAMLAVVNFPLSRAECAGVDVSV